MRESSFEVIIVQGTIQVYRIGTLLAFEVSIVAQSHNDQFM